MGEVLGGGGTYEPLLSVDNVANNLGRRKREDPADSESQLRKKEKNPHKSDTELIVAPEIQELTHPTGTSLSRTVSPPAETIDSTKRKRYVLNLFIKL